MPAPEDLAAAREFIAAADWRFAKTMPENPHWWTKPARGPNALVALIKAGEVRRYRGRRYTTVEIDGFAYWLTWGGGYIVNRKPAAEAGWDGDDG
jgi:hypothetical protein